MSEIFGSTELNEEERYPLLAPDPLGVLESTRAVLLEGEQVWINQEELLQLAARWERETREQGETSMTLPWSAQYHFQDGTEKTLNWLLLLDSLNFCFWAEPGQPRWSIDYEGKTLNGYWAEAAALKRAVEEGIPLWDADYLKDVSEETVAGIFRGSEKIPLFAERVANIREIGQVLSERFGGQFANAIEQAEYDVVTLVQLLIEHFPSFRDTASYHGQEVRFYKRAQICVADIAGSFQGKVWGELIHLEQLTAFADYKLPQVLRHAQVIEYEPALAERINKQEILPIGGEEEIEIRAATIWACELLRQELQGRGISSNAIEIDQRLWMEGQDSAHMQPYHRTRTLYY